MTPTDSSPSTAPQDSYADWDETASGRRPGDDPFLPEEGLFWWLPKAALLLVVLLGLGYLAIATVQHGKYQLVRSSEGNAGLERGRFALSGWAPFVPDGALEAWSPIAWPPGSVPSPLSGDLVDLANTYLGFLRSAASAHIEDDAQLDLLSAREERFEAWYRDRWGDDSVPQPGDVKALRTARDLARREVLAASEAAAEEQRRAELAAKHQAEVEDRARLEQEQSSLDRARSYATRRRLLLKEAEALLEGLPEGGGPEATRDRDAVERLIDSMNTPVGFP
jgi:hypothetical protein